MRRVLLANGRLIDPATGLDALGDLLIEGNCIAAIGDDLNAETIEDVIDCRGKLVVPGFIDIHVHLREPPVEPAETAELPETVTTGAGAAVAGGFTRVCPMPNTTPPIDTPAAVEAYLAKADRAGLARVHPVGALTYGRSGTGPADMAAMKAAGAVAFSDDGADVQNPEVFRAVCTEAARASAVVICHCEVAELAEGGAMHAGKVAESLGVAGIPREAEDRAVDRACRMARETGCRIHVAHVSTAGAVDLVRGAKADGAPVTAEATPHHLSLTHEALAEGDALYKVNPPLRTAEDVAAVVNGVVDDTIDALATDHAPHSPEAKARSLAGAPMGMVGLESALPVYRKVLVEPGHLSWSELIRRMATRPAELLGLPGGSLAIGAPADITVLDPEARWTIDPDRFAGRARNCPFEGWRVTGRVERTLVGGKVVFALAEG